MSVAHFIKFHRVNWIYWRVITDNHIERILLVLRASSIPPPARLYRILAWCLIPVSLLYYAWLLTNGTFNFFAPELHDLAFNSMFLHLLDGEFNVDPETIGIEAHVKDGKTYAYFGLYPALLRAPVWAVTDIERLHLGRPSSLLAIAVLLVFQTRMLLAVFRGCPADGFRVAVFLAVLLATLLAGPQVYMTAVAKIQHEPVLWAAAFATIFNERLVASLFGGVRLGARDINIMALAAGLAAHNRPLVALGLYIALSGLIAWTFVGNWRAARAAQIVATAPSNFTRAVSLIRAEPAIFIAPLIILFVFGLAVLGVNYARWSDPFSFDYIRGYALLMDDPRRAAMYAEHGRFDLSKIAFSIWYYLLGGPLMTLDMLYSRYDWVEGPVAAALLMHPLILVGAVFGGLRLRPAGAAVPGAACFRIAACGQFVTVLLMLSLISMSLRYQVDGWPVIALVGVVGCQGIVHGADGLGRRERRLILGIAWAFVGIGAYWTHAALIAYKAADSVDPAAQTFLKGLGL